MYQEGIVLLVVIPSDFHREFVLPVPTSVDSLAFQVLAPITGHRKHPTVLSAITTTWSFGFLVFTGQKTKERRTIVGPWMLWDASR